MNRIMFLFATVGYLIISGQQALAGAGWTDYGRIRLLTTSTTRFAVKIDTASNPTKCRDQPWFYHDYGKPGSDKMFEMLLAAFTSEKRIKVHVTGICDDKGMSEISSVSIFP